MFGEAHAMKLDGRTQFVRSYAGSLCSILILLVTALYGFQKLVVLIEKKDVSVLSTTLDSFYDENFVFAYEDGFNVAVAFTGFNNVVDYELDPSYGELIFNAVQWGTYEDGSYFEHTNKLNHHSCSDYELSISDQDGLGIPTD